MTRGEDLVIESWGLGPPRRRSSENASSEGRRSFLRRFRRALGDRASYALTRNPGALLGFLLAVPIPVVALASSSPTWICGVALAAPIAWAGILGAVGRVARMEEIETDRVAVQASSAATTHARESAILRQDVQDERSGRERSESSGRRADVELALAQTVHRSLLPVEIHDPDVVVVVRQFPCTFVGGDYLHATRIGADRLYLGVGDVSGHGVAAALVVSRFHGLVQRLVLEERSPEQILDHLDRAVAEILHFTAFFLTFAVCRVDLARRRIEYATAGHPPLLLVRRNGSVEELSTGNGLLGTELIDVRGPVRTASTGFEEGDSLLLYTDGLFEIQGRGEGDLLGESAIREILPALARRPPEVLAAELLRMANDFRAAERFDDDVSLMVVRFRAATPPTAVTA